MKNKKSFLFILIIIFLTALMNPMDVKKHKKKKKKKKITTQMTAVMPSGTLKITYFKASKEGSHTRAMMSIGGSSTSPRTSTTVRLGERVNFSWRIDACKMQDIDRVDFSGYMAPTEIGDVHVKSSDSKYYSRSGVRISPSRSKTYTLNVQSRNTINGLPKGDQKSFTVNVIAPRIEGRRPQVNQDNGKVSFYVKNTGDVDYGPADITFEYEVNGRSPTQSLASDRLTVRDISLRRNQQVKIHEITLPDSAFSSQSLVIKVSAYGGSSSFPQATHWKTYNHRWESRELRITNDTLRLASMIISGRVRLNNHTSVSGDVVKNLPYVENDCVIELNTFSQSFNIPWFRLGSTPVEIYFLVRNLNVHRISRDDLLFIRNGKLGMRITFDTSPSREIKGWGRDAIGKKYRDDWGPDVDITELSLEIMMTPVLESNQVTYSSIEVIPTLNLTFPGGWSGLNALRDWAISYLTDEIRPQFEAVLNSDSVKPSIESQLNSVITVAAPNLHHIFGLSRGGGTIVIHYR